MRGLRKREYPTVAQAAAAAALIVALQLLIGTILGAFRIVPDPAVSNGALTAIANLLSFGFVIFISRRRSTFDLLQAVRNFDSSPLFLVSLLFTVAGMGILLSELDNLVRLLLPMPEELARFFEELLVGRHVLLAAALLVVVAPLTEETLFRGIFLHGFLRNYPPGLAAFLSALLFALLHLNPWQFFGAFFLGLYLALLYILTRSLSACLLGHALQNGLPLFTLHVLRLRIPGYTMGFGEAGFQPAWLDLAGAGLLAAGALLGALHFRAARAAA